MPQYLSEKNSEKKMPALHRKGESQRKKLCPA